MIANQITDKQKISRLAHLANACRLTVCVDNKENAADIEAAAKLAGSTVNLHDRIYLVDGEDVVDRFIVTARGCFR